MKEGDYLFERNFDSRQYFSFRDISRYTTLGQPMLGWDTYVAQRPVYARRISANLDICATLHLTALSNVACVVHLQPLGQSTSNHYHMKISTLRC
jgi:hypothetical protein